LSAALAANEMKPLALLDWLSHDAPTAKSWNACIVASRA